MNWRKPFILGLLYLSGSKIPTFLREIRKLEKLSPDELQEYQSERLKRLLQHAHQHVPYYREILDRHGIIGNGQVRLENFSKIPPLTKKIIRDQGDRLLSKERGWRGTYENASAGSMGEPVHVIQDKYYYAWNIANKMYYKTFSGQGVGERELRLWGSVADIFKGREFIIERLKYWLYNRKELNAFRMSEKNMHHFVDEINRFKPAWIEAYAESMYEFTRFIRKNALRVHRPRGILTTAGTLFPDMKELIHDVFDCPVFDRYGTREVGDMACSCIKNKGLHVSMWNSYLEVLDDHLQPAGPGEPGKVYVTCLTNYSMPMIRYDIGDIAVKGENTACSCGRPTPVLKKVTGRETSVFKTKDGGLIDGSYIRFVIYLAKWIEKFQIIQKDYDLILIKIVVADPFKSEDHTRDMDRFTREIRNLMGEDCRVEWECLEQIPPLDTGKYLFTISEIPSPFQ